MIAEQPPERSARLGINRRLRGLAFWIFPFGLGLLGAVAGLLLFSRPGDDPDQVTMDGVETAVADAIEEAQDAPAVAAEVFQIIYPSLVTVNAHGGGEGGAGGGLGSGVIVNTDGSILTAHHVIAGAARITVNFADGTEANAQVVTAVPENDLAVLLADSPPEVIVPAVLTSSGGLQIGDEAFAVGNPLGLVASITAGVISGLGRTMPLSGTGMTLEGLIQFDAAVNPGSSGGPLLNRDGAVIGIVTALANPSDDHSFSGIGFAIPLSSAGGAGGPPQ